MIESSPVHSRFASVLRWSGMGVFALSGVVFLLQGLDYADGLLRNWSYLIMMVVVGALGVGVHRWFRDDKSARLLLGVGVALIPVQFAQMAGRVHDLLGIHQSNWLGASAALEGSNLLLGATASILLAAPGTPLPKRRSAC